MSYIYERDSQKKKEHYKRLKSAVFELLGKSCVVCGFDDNRALQIDHINGGGSKERKIIQTREYYYHILAKSEESILKYQILCANCNWIKRVEQNENKGRTKT